MLCACEVNAGHNTRITLCKPWGCLCICVYVTTVGQELCQSVCNSLNNISAIWAMSILWTSVFYFLYSQNSPEIWCIQIKSNRESHCVIFLEEQLKKKRELSYFVHKYNTLIHHLPQSRPQKGTPFLSKLTFLDTKTTWATLFLKSRLRIIRKRGSLKLEFRAASSKIVWALHPHGGFFSLTVTVKWDPCRGHIPSYQLHVTLSVKRFLIRYHKKSNCKWTHAHTHTHLSTVLLLPFKVFLWEVNHSVKHGCRPVRRFSWCEWKFDCM